METRTLGLPAWVIRVTKDLLHYSSKESVGCIQFTYASSLKKSKVACSLTAFHGNMGMMVFIDCYEKNSVWQITDKLTSKQVKGGEILSDAYLPSNYITLLTNKTHRLQKEHRWFKAYKESTTIILLEHSLIYGRIREQIITHSLGVAHIYYCITVFLQNTKIKSVLVRTN